MRRSRIWVSAVVALTAMAWVAASNPARAQVDRAAPHAKTTTTSRSLPTTTTVPTKPPGTVEVTLAVDGKTPDAVAPANVAGAFGSVWVIAHRSPVLFRVDPATNEVTTVPVPDTPAQNKLCFLPFAIADRLRIHECGPRALSVDPATGDVVTVPPEEDGFLTGTSLWTFAGFPGPDLVLVRRDPDTFAELAHVDLEITANSNGQPPGTECMGSLWTPNGHIGAYVPGVQRTDLATNATRTIFLKTKVLPVHNNPPLDVGCAAGKVWIPTGAGLFRIDPETNSATRVPVPTSRLTAFSDVNVVVDGDDVYFRSSDTTVVKVDGNTGQVVKTYPARGGGGGIAIADGSLWVVNATDGTLWRHPL